MSQSQPPDDERSPNSSANQSHRQNQSGDKIDSGTSSVQGSNNRAVQGDDNQAVQGDKNQVLQIIIKALNLPITLIKDENVSEKQAKPQRDETQQTLLDWVEHEVAARLKQSLHNQVSILLEKEEDPTQVNPPWAIDVKIGTGQPFRLPPDTTITSTFLADDSKNLLTLSKFLYGVPLQGSFLCWTRRTGRVMTFFL